MKECCQGLTKSSFQESKPLIQLSTTLIDQIINLRDQTGYVLYRKFSIDSIISNLQKHQIQVVELFSKYMKEGFNLLEFVRFFLNIIPHQSLQNLYLSIGLIDLFRAITSTGHRERVLLKDITDYMCEKVLRQGNYNQVQARYLPVSTFFEPKPHNRRFLQMPPKILGQNDDKIYKLSQKSIETDSSKHSRAIVRSQFSQQLKKIFILDGLSDSIALYDESCSLLKKISPQLGKLKKEVIILSFAFSERQLRVGAVMKDFSLKFWDHFNRFEYEKSISTTSVCQSLQTCIYFLQYFNIWVTGDKTGTLYFWDLLQEKPCRSLKCKYQAVVTSLCQIPALNLLVVVQECKRSSRLLIETQDKNDGWSAEAAVVIYNYFSGQIVTEISLQGQRIPHTLAYSSTYQILFMSGLQKRIKLYEFHPIYMDACLKGELIGHQNLITSFTLIRDTPMLVSADDKGKVKLWDYRGCICLQTIDFSDKTVITNLLDMVDLGKLGVFGSRVNYIDYEDRLSILKRRAESESLKIDAIDFDAFLMRMYIFSNRSLRVLNLKTGQIQCIFNLSRLSDVDYTAFRYIPSLQKIVLGSSNGVLSLHSGATGELLEEFNESHDGGVSYIDYDEYNKLFVSFGNDAKIMVHRSVDYGVCRQFRNNFTGKDMSCFELSVYHNFLVIGSGFSESVFIWSYQFGKLLGEVQMRKGDVPVAIHVINGYGIILVATSSGAIQIIRTTTTASELDLELIMTHTIAEPIVSVKTDLKFRGHGKSATCQHCHLLICTQKGRIFSFDLTELISKEAFKVHCRQKSSYNPFREVKQNFISQLQKNKHTILKISNQEELRESKAFFGQRVVSSGFQSIQLCELLKLENSFTVVVGNDNRIKIWNYEHQLLCDLNIKFCLPYRWDLLPSSRTLQTEKIYYGIKVLEAIMHKYEQDISIGESKNLSVRQLFSHLDKTENKCKMITQPEDTECSNSKKVTLLQSQYSKKDLNFSLVKRFNFTEVAGPTLKELDNIKKIQTLQKEWKVKEQREKKEKESLLKNIETKAKKNEEKDQIQFLFVKHPPKHQHKVTFKDSPTLQEKDNLHSLIKKLQSIQHKQDDKKHFQTVFSKSYYPRFPAKAEHEARQIPKDTVTEIKRHHSSKQLKKSFEGYYRTKKGVDGELRFRDILTEMNGRVNSIKKCRFNASKHIKQKTVNSLLD